MATRKKAPNAKPPKRVDRRKTMSTRLTPETRAKLEAATTKSRRSLAQEIEFRLEQSFAEEKSQAEIFGETFGKLETFLVARLLAHAIHTIETVTGKNWMDDPEAHRQTQNACKNILDAFRPPGGKGTMGIDMTFGETIGKDAAIKAIKTEFEQTALRAILRMKKKAE